MRRFLYMMFFSIALNAGPEETAQNVFTELLNEGKIILAPNNFSYDGKKIYVEKIISTYWDAELSRYDSPQIKEFLKCLNIRGRDYLTYSFKPFYVDFDWQPKDSTTKVPIKRKMPDDFRYLTDRPQKIRRFY